MTNLIIGLLIGGIAAWYLGVKYAHVMISLECERLGGFFFGDKTCKCVAVVEQEAESGVPDAILEATKETCHHFSTTFFADGKATCFDCGAIVNGRREVLGASRVGEK